jgi:hypothetical protein
MAGDVGKGGGGYEGEKDNKRCNEIPQRQLSRKSNYSNEVDKHRIPRAHVPFCPGGVSATLLPPGKKRSEKVDLRLYETWPSASFILYLLLA